MDGPSVCVYVCMCVCVRVCVCVCVFVASIHGLYCAYYDLEFG